MLVTEVDVPEANVFLADVPIDLGGLRTVAELGLTHIDTSCYYGPSTVNNVIREALHPYPDDLHIVTKVGFRRNADRAWLPALSPEELTAAVHVNLEQLGLEALDVVNLRVGSAAVGPARSPGRSACWPACRARA